MHHLLLGYGYTAYHLTQFLLANHQNVSAYSRTCRYPVPHGLRHECHDLEFASLKIPENTCLYYFIPPSDLEDSLLAKVLNNLNSTPQKIIYIGSSGIYGDYHGQDVKENSICHLRSPRQKQRQAAEQLVQDYAHRHKIPAILCRLAGIYGPGRLPIDAVLQQLPVVHPMEAPLINHIYVKDLSFILANLAQLSFTGVLNLADGEPCPMGQLQQKLAELMNYPLAPEIDFNQAWAQASPMKREFLEQSKRLNIDLLKQLVQTLNYDLHSLEAGLIASLA